MSKLLGHFLHITKLAYSFYGDNMLFIHPDMFHARGMVRTISLMTNQKEM
jgi:hypothetical protein